MNQKSDLPVGTILTSENDVKVVVRKATKGCSGCHYYDLCLQPPKIKVMPCFGHERTDGEPVYYPEYKQ